MKALRLSPDLSLPAVEAVAQTYAVVGVRGTGKTHTAVVFVEELLDARQQVVILDPLDVWWGLRLAADGTTAGYPITVLGGNHGDLPLEEPAGALLADLVVEESVSLVLSLRRLSKSGQRRFVTDFLERLFQRKGEARYRTPLQVVTDEAHRFIPQRVVGGDERMVGAMSAIYAEGRSSGLGGMILSQRPAKLHKDVLSEVEMLVCHRLIGPQDRKAIEEWIEAHDVLGQRKVFMESLASLPKGEAWFWSPGWLNVFQRAKVRARRTFDSSATPRPGVTPAAPRPLAPVDLARLQARMAELPLARRGEEDRPEALDQPARPEAAEGVAEVAPARARPRQESKLLSGPPLGVLRQRRQQAPIQLPTLSPLWGPLRAILDAGRPGAYGPRQLVHSGPRPDRSGAARPLAARPGRAGGGDPLRARGGPSPDAQQGGPGESSGEGSRRGLLWQHAGPAADARAGGGTGRARARGGTALTQRRDAMNMELALREVLSAVVADWSADEHHDVPVALIDQARALLAGPVVPWRPTPAAINALPEPLRRYVHDLETRCDPAGDVQRIASLEEQVGGLTRLAEEHQAARVAAERERDDYARSLHTFVRDSGGRSPSKVLEELQTAEARAVAAERDAEEAGEGLVIVTQQLEDTDARLAALEAERDALRGALEAVAKAARTLSEAMDAFYETEVAGDGWVNPERAWARYAELEVLHDALDAALAPRPAAPEGR